MVLVWKRIKGWTGARCFGQRALEVTLVGLGRVVAGHARWLRDLRTMLRAKELKAPMRAAQHEGGHDSLAGMQPASGQPDSAARVAPARPVAGGTHP